MHKPSILGFVRILSNKGQGYSLVFDLFFRGQMSLISNINTFNSWKNLASELCKFWKIIVFPGGVDKHDSIIQVTFDQ